MWKLNKVQRGTFRCQCDKELLAMLGSINLVELEIGFADSLPRWFSWEPTRSTIWKSQVKKQTLFSKTIVNRYLVNRPRSEQVGLACPPLAVIRDAWPQGCTASSGPPIPIFLVIDPQRRLLSWDYSFLQNSAGAPHHELLLWIPVFPCQLWLIHSTCASVRMGRGGFFLILSTPLPDCQFPNSPSIV